MKVNHACKKFLRKFKATFKSGIIARDFDYDGYLFGKDMDEECFQIDELIQVEEIEHR